MDGIALKIFSVELDLILTIYLAICLEEEADKHLEALSQFSKIFLEADKDLVVLEGKGVLICYMKLLFL